MLLMKEGSSIKNVDTTTVQIRAGGDSYFNGGNVGIGLTNPSDYYAQDLVVGASNEGGITLVSGTVKQCLFGICRWYIW